MKLNFSMMIMVAACGNSHGGHVGPELVAPEYNVTCGKFDFSPDVLKGLSPYGCGPGCTGNSPVVNTFPINGIAKNGDGICNPEGVQILPHSLHGGGCGWGTSLGLDKSGRLIGMRDDGTAVCDSQELAGAAFIARSGASTTLELTIANVRMLEVTPPEKPREGYRIESGGQSLCDSGAANRARQELRLPVQPTYQVPGADPEDDGNTDLVIPVGGPIYSNDVRLIDHGEKLFNLACASDALAKRSLNEIEVGTADTEDQQVAALRMLTASYCGKQRTIRGMTLDWQSPATAPLEADWLGRTTSCLDKPRLAYLSVQLLAKFPKELLPQDCQKNGCADWGSWEKAIRSECAESNLPPLLRCTPDPTNATSTAPDPKYDFQSFVHQDKAVDFGWTKKRTP